MPARDRRRLGVGLAIATLVAGAPVGAQILGPVGNVVGGLPGVERSVGQTTNGVLGRGSNLVDRTLDPQALAQTRAERLASLIARNRAQLEADPAGDPVVRGEVAALSPTAGAVAAAQAAGFQVLRRTRLPELGLDVTIFAPPPGVSSQAGLRRLRRLDPTGDFDFNHIYLGAGEQAATPSPAAAAATPGGTEPVAADVRVGLIDTGLMAELPVFAGVRIRERGFAPGAPKPAAHAVATGSLISGRLAAFRGAAPGASLDVADIYGSTAAGGSAEDLAAALEWMAEIREPVVSVSLVGPPNALVEAAVQALSRRGTRIVAAVGNDGPAAPPAYPASYPGVIAVAPVDARGRVLPEAGRARHVDFAAPGAGIEAASLSGGLAPVRGASFAAPIVAGRLARLLRRPDPDAAAKALAELARDARPAGPGAGRGIVGDDLRLADGHH